MGRLSSQTAASDSEAVAASVEVSFSLESPASLRALCCTCGGDSGGWLAQEFG